MGVMTAAPSTAAKPATDEPPPSHKAALNIVHGNVYIVIDGGERKPFLLDSTAVTAEVLGEALNDFQGDWQVFIIGTRADGTAGWDEIDAAALTGIVNHPLTFLTEGEALHAAGAGDGKPSGYLILAEKPAFSPTDALGSARWWVASDQGVRLANFTFLGNDHGQLYTLAGGPLADTPSILGCVIESLVKNYPDVECVFVWSQGGIVGQEYNSPDGEFWKHLNPPRAFDEGGGRVHIMTDPAAVLQLLTAPAE
jgi:hypothetical protein